MNLNPLLQTQKIRDLLTSNLCLSIVFLLSMISTSAGQVAEDQSKPITISVNIDFGDGLVWQYNQIPYQNGMTVLDAMEYLRNRKVKPLEFSYQGSGQNAFLKSIAGAANEGGGRSAKNWFFRINEKLGNRSFGLTELKPGDVVLWHFGKYQPGS